MCTTKIIRLSCVAVSSTVSLRLQMTFTIGGTMSIHRIHGRQSHSPARAGTTRSVERERSLNPLWMVTFAAGLLFGMLAVLLTAG